ncbi:MAG: thioredoxin domain-containing protein [Caldilineaceae bacterium]
MAIDTVIHTNAQSVDRVLQVGLPTALVFWNRLEPIGTEWERMLEAAVKKYAGRLLVAKVDAEAEVALVQRYHVQSLPALILIQKGTVEATLPNTAPATEIQAWLQHLVEGGQRPATTRVTTSTRTTTEPSKATNSTTQPVTLTDGNFDRIIQGTQPVLVDFGHLGVVLAAWLHRQLKKLPAFKAVPSSVNSMSMKIL